MRSHRRWQGRTLAACASACSLIVLAASSFCVAGCGGDDGGDPAAPADAAAPPAGGVPAPPPPPPDLAPAGLRVWFKLDPRLTTGVYMGERWVSPPTFQAATQTGASFTVEARADGSAGSSSATWTASDPDMMSVSPATGGEVVIAVYRAGRSTLTVGDGTTSVSLTVDAVHEGGAWRVQFSR